jgi:hypothetical protein
MILRITFNGVPTSDALISFQFDANYPFLPVNNVLRAHVFKELRNGFGRVTRGTNANTQAAFYQQALMLDYGSSITAFVSANVVEIVANNGSSFLEWECDSSLVAFELVDGSYSNNAIHEIIFTPRQYAYPAIMNRDYLITEDDYLVITEDNYKIRL